MRCPKKRVLISRSPYSVSRISLSTVLEVQVSTRSSAPLSSQQLTPRTSRSNESALAWRAQVSSMTAKPGVTPAFSGYSRRTVAQKEWNVMTGATMRSSSSTCAGRWESVFTSCLILPLISAAALSVNVRARTSPMDAPCSQIRAMYRCTRTWVLPVPAPAVTTMLCPWPLMAFSWPSGIMPGPPRFPPHQEPS